MKIWFPTIRARSGSDVYVERLSLELRKRGIDVVVSWFNHLHEVCPILLKRIPAPPGVDVIHANSWTAFAFKRAGIPLVVTMHHSVHDPEYAPYRNLAQAMYHNLLIRNYEDRGIKAAEKVVAVSHYTADVTARLFGSKKIVVIQNGIDTSRFSPGIEKIFDNQKFNLLFVGSASKRKGFDFLMQVMEKLGPDYHLHYTSEPGLFGPSPTQNSSCVEKLNEDQLVNVYRGADALIFPSRYEGFGYVVAEAMACGKPVIAARTSALPELIENGENGILCSPDSVEEFIAAIRQLQNDKDYADKMALKARKTIVDNFGLDQMVEKYIDLYKSII